VDAGTDANIAVACRQVDGVVLQPGEVFSFRTLMAPARGLLKPGRAILEGHYVLSTGGGYCQVATALYNAALLAGLPVVERRHHSLFDPQDAYVPAGFDASVSSFSDFRFQNDRKTPLVVRVRKEDEAVTVQLECAGTAPAVQSWTVGQVLGRERVRTHRERSRVLAAGQTQLVQPGYAGLKVVRWRYWLEDGLTRTASLGADTYQMVPRVVEVGTGPGKKP
jgi:vancomycin resistance protein YoaR